MTWSRSPSASRISTRPPHAIEAAHQAALAGDTKYPPQDGTLAAEAGGAAAVPARPRARLRARRDHGRQRRQAGDLQRPDGDGGRGRRGAHPGAVLGRLHADGAGWSAARRCMSAARRTTDSGCGRRICDAAITPRTKWLMLNFPNNPTGAVASRAELAALAEVLLRHPHVWVMSDDMYEHLSIPTTRYATLAEVEPRLRDRTLTVSGVSKTYAMTGWRIGFAGGPRDLIRGMVTMQGHATAGVSTVGQAAAAAALDGPQDAGGRARRHLPPPARPRGGGAERHARACPATGRRARSTCSPTSPAASARPPGRPHPADRRGFRPGAAGGERMSRWCRARRSA